jgi:hypothetical protein
MMYVNQCLYCKHYHKLPGGKVEELTLADAGKAVIRYCLAYPEGIPKELWEDEVDHRYPYKGDGGITFVGKSEGLDRIHKDKFLRYPVKRVYMEEEEAEPEGGG